MTIKNTDMALPLHDIFPKDWSKKIGKCHFLPFRNIEHFKHEVGKISQRSDNMCGMTYAQSLEMLVKGKTDFLEEEQESIRNLVRSNLLKRGLLTEEVYENFRYTTDGTQVDVDVGKYVSGEPDCVMSPSKQYVDFFYELYVNISYPYNVANSDVRKNVAKLLATVEELERRHIFVKITLVLPISGCARDDVENFFSSIPLFSHKDPKSVTVMSSVINDRLLRKFYFAILETIFQEKLSSSYGSAVQLPKAMNVGFEFDEIRFYEDVVNELGA
jgi:hypothetical protein